MNPRDASVAVQGSKGKARKLAQNLLSPRSSQVMVPIYDLTGPESADLDASEIIVERVLNLSELKRLLAPTQRRS
jgi:hypothetical protein